MPDRDQVELREENQAHRRGLGGGWTSGTLDDGLGRASQERSPTVWAIQAEGERLDCREGVLSPAGAECTRQA